MRGLAGLRVLVTGAGQGIGQAVAQRFAEEVPASPRPAGRCDVAAKLRILRQVAAGRVSSCVA